VGDSYTFQTTCEALCCVWKMPQPVMIFHIVLYIYTLAQWLGFKEFFFFFFFLFSLPKYKGVILFIFISNLVLIILKAICFAFLSFYWFFSSILSHSSWFYLIFISNLVLILLIIIFFSNWILFFTLGIWFQVIFILNLVFILFINIYFILDPFYYIYFSIPSINILLI